MNFRTELNTKMVHLYKLIKEVINYCSVNISAIKLYDSNNRTIFYVNNHGEYDYYEYNTNNEETYYESDEKIITTNRSGEIMEYEKSNTSEPFRYNFK